MSQGEYTVTTTPMAARTYPNKNKAGSNLVVWRLGLQDAQSAAPDGLFELHMNEGNDPPAVGDTLDVERFITGEFSQVPFSRIKKVWKQDGGDKSSGGGGGKDDFERRPDHPINMARALHTSALSSTPVFIDQMLTIGAVPQPSTEAEYWALVGRVCGRLRASYPDAVLAQADGPQAGSTAQNGGGEVPADTTGLEPQPAPAGTSEFGF